jgi:biotin carboxyl carrier protein
MKCLQPSLWVVAVLGGAVLLVSPALASNNPLAGAMGNLRWGMRDHDVKSALRSELTDKSKLSGLEASYVEFDGHPTRWDNTSLAEEYTHGNDEAMMTVEDNDGTRNYYFFIGGELWKWVKLYPPSAVGGRDFAGFTSTIQRRFGKGHSKKGEVNSGTGKTYKFVEYVDRNTRVRAVDKSKEQGNYALMFESLDTVRSLATLRSNTPRSSATERAANDSAREDSPSAQQAQPKHEEDDADEDSVTSPLAGSATSAKGRSIFSAGGDGDGNKDGVSRSTKSRAQANARKAQPRGDDRPARTDRQTRSLDRLLGDDGDDPLLGLPE